MSARDEALRKMKLKYEVYQRMIQSAEGCLGVLRMHLRHCKDPDTDKFATTLGSIFTKRISLFPPRESEKYQEMYDEVISEVMNGRLAK